MAMLMLRILIGLYALLMLFAGFQVLIKEENKLYIIHIMVSLITLISAFFANWQLFTIVAIAAIIAYQLLALYRGLTTFFHWQHHVIRLIISVAVIVLLVTAH
ncbi:hypothetical protein [Periweissella ghanensis]|uniref:Uncharacterized protein n=1 Tax=Periweissella ghanensis TaxID=467997 RepID=A0ABM8Z8Z7_9LACO|nr:hypothetical protein [Periweissella ghanensis]MCM0601094.1 hypothetical protein [Periweissella ghanensis]CAH0417823.1 hypothetical protein WGH24286_00238 [Periweissella ghanensis]